MALTKATFSMIDGEFASIRDFGAVGDGVTDDTAALTAFFNHANANPGVRHLMDDAIYLVTSVLPTISVSNVWIEGAGAEIHDTGELISGTVIKWGGTPGTVGPLIRITAVSGASNQRISSVNFTGIGIDCNSGAIDYGMEILSARFCDINVAIANAGFAGLTLGVVATLGESKDLQRCNIELQARQVEAPNGFCLVLGGDAAANVSMNTFWVDAQISNLQAIYCVNSDNNIWDYVRVFKTPAGTVTESVSLLGGPNPSEKARGEHFNFFTSNVPIHAYGTGSTPPFASSSGGNTAFLDKENGTPNPIIDGGASVAVTYDTTAGPEDDWVQYTPTVTASSGTLGTHTAEAWYIRRGNIVQIKMQINITTNGTAAGYLDATIPINAVGYIGSMLTGRERTTNKAITAFVDGGGATASRILFYDGTYPGGNGYILTFSGFYEVT